MATLGAEVLTLTDWAKRLDPDGKIADIAELLSQQNEILLDMLFMEANEATSHTSTIRTGLPTVYWRLFNQGVLSSKSTTAQIKESMGMLEAWSDVDKDLAMLNGNTAQFRLSEGAAFVEAMNQEFASTVFYGNSSVSPEEFNGLSIRYSSLSANNARNIIDAGGTDSGTDLSSIWLVVWGNQSVHGIFPKGSQAGLVHEDIGETVSENVGGVSGSKMKVFRDRWQQKAGLVVKDWRYAARACNIDISNLVSKTNAADIIELMIKLTHRVENLSAGKAAFYMNRTMIQMLDILRRDDVQAGGGLSWDTVDGKIMYSFRGIPIRRTDALLQTESQVS